MCGKGADSVGKMRRGSKLSGWRGGTERIKLSTGMLSEIENQR